MYVRPARAQRETGKSLISRTGGFAYIFYVITCELRIRCVKLKDKERNDFFYCSSRKLVR